MGSVAGFGEYNSARFTILERNPNGPDYLAGYGDIYSDVVGDKERFESGDVRESIVKVMGNKGNDERLINEILNVLNSGKSASLELEENLELIIDPVKSKQSPESLPEKSPIQPTRTSFSDSRDNRYIAQSFFGEDYFERGVLVFSRTLGERPEGVVQVPNVDKMKMELNGQEVLIESNQNGTEGQITIGGETLTWPEDRARVVQCFGRTDLNSVVNNIKTAILDTQGRFQDGRQISLRELNNAYRDMDFSAQPVLNLLSRIARENAR
jgi:hypothetical protein